MPEKNTENDLGIRNEISFAVANLIQLEEHLSISIADTESEDLISILNEVRSLGAKYMKEYTTKELPSQLWCSVKHTLSTAFRLIEIGEKNISLKEHKKAIGNFKDAKDLFQLSFIIIEGNYGLDKQPEG